MGFISKAVRINSANQITDGVITGAKLANDTITANKIAILDYIRSLQYDVYNDAGTVVKARLDHDETTNFARFLAGADATSLNNVFYIASQSWPSGFAFGQKVSVVDMNLKRLGNLGSPAVVGDALRFGAAEITNNEINPSANISRTKLAVGSPQRATGKVFANAGGSFDITGLITPTSYPALVIGFTSVESFSALDFDILHIRDQNGANVVSSNYALIDDNGVNEGIFYGVSNLLSAMISAGSVKLVHEHNPTETSVWVTGTLMVIEL